jgi:multiple sugar transport system ATP-binding protein
MSRLVLQDLCKTYVGGHEAVRNMNLETTDSELVVVVGPSGCGKTTALRMIAGLEEVTSGRIELDGALQNEVDPGARDVAMVFQNYALYPHLSVRGNLAFPLRERKVPKRERERQVREVAAVLGLEREMEKKPGQLSGGQRQRVAMGRAIVRHPKLFLMDEPLSNLDAKLRVEMRTEIHAIQRRLGITTLYVTHDQVEAMTLGDRVVVMHDGVVQQIGTPSEVYELPCNLFVATFLGNPGTNLFRGRVAQNEQGLIVEIAERRLAIDETELSSQPGVRERIGASVVVGIRPEAFELETDTAFANRRLPATVALTEALGSSVLAYFETPGIENGNSPSDAEGESSSASTASGALVRRAWGVARFGPGTRIEDGQKFEVALHAGSMRFFDPETGSAL